jgi:hypothetical protein
MLAQIAPEALGLLALLFVGFVFFVVCALGVALIARTWAVNRFGKPSTWAMRTAERYHQEEVQEEALAEMLGRVRNRLRKRGREIPGDVAFVAEEPCLVEPEPDEEEEDE